MYQIAVLCMLVSTAFAVNRNEIEWINNAQKFWKARPNAVTVMGDEYMTTLLGTHLVRTNITYRNDIEIVENIPESFDAREHWTNCGSISSIKDQGHCGSCWAISATSVLSDRICIATNGKVKVDISAENLLSCCSTCIRPDHGGCEGGYADKAWEYIKHTGVVTGGDYDSSEGCQPYEIAPSNGNVYTPPCHSSCTNIDYLKPYGKDKHFGQNAYAIPKNTAAIQSEILKHGPVQAGFIVYKDFFAYSTGVYVRMSEIQRGGHGVRILGWGVEDGVDYWLVANSWGKNWGDDGTFKIRRGTNECDFESNVIAGLARSSVYKHPNNRM